MKKKIIKTEDLKFKDFFKFSEIIQKYQKENSRASQVVLCVEKITTYWFIGKRTCNNHYEVCNWFNWLYSHSTFNAKEILIQMQKADSRVDYADLLMQLSNELLNEDNLQIMNSLKKVGNINKSYGKMFKIIEEY